MDTPMLYAPWIVYQNVIAMMGYRGITVTSQQLTQDKVATEMNTQKYVTITGRRVVTGKTITSTIMITAPDSKFTSRTQDFRKLTRDIKTNEFMVVSDTDMAKHIQKQTAVFKEDNPDVYLEFYSYDIFMYEQPKHESVPKHTVVTDENELRMLKERYTELNKLPQIKADDPSAVWIGLRPKQIVRIERPSATAGEAVAYRYCV